MCERCGKLGIPRQQFEHIGVTMCFVCADERVAELGAEGSWANDNYESGLSLGCRGGRVS